MNCIKSCLLVFLLFKNFWLFGQTSQAQKFLTRLIPPSPEASGMTRYGNYEMSLFNGTPAISIPIYEIKVGELKVPIAINYHASGIKVNEIASRVGLGWDLQAGGAITRKIMGGKADEAVDYGYFSATSTSENRVKSGTEINPFTQAGLDYLNNVEKKIYDVEPDLFSYSFPGHSGKFLFNQKNNFTPFYIPYAPIAVSFTPSNNHPFGFQIKDESGIAYKFDSTEWTNTISSNSVYATSSWMLTDVISANMQDSIHF